MSDATIHPLHLRADMRRPETRAEPQSALHRAAVEFEAVFLAEMLSHAGFGAERGSFGGGAGESGFSGMLVQEYARDIAESRSTGIAARIEQALARRGEL